MHTISKIVFLLYVPRSGSTFLSAQLDKFPDIGVTIEGKFMSTLLSTKNQILKNQSVCYIYDILLRNERFCNLGISRDDFLFHLKNYSTYNIENITRSLLSSYFSKVKPSSTIWIVKEGLNGYLINQIAQEIPSAKFVHLIRDGRAVFNSRLQTIRPYAEGRKMARDPLTAARSWTSLVNRVDAYRLNHPQQCVEIRYEDLISDVEGQMNFLCKFFGIEFKEKSCNHTKYYDRIPEKEKVIHALVGNAAIPERIDKWRKELSFEDRILFQFRSDYILKRHGYIVDEDINFFSLFLNKDIFMKYLHSYMKRFYDWMSILTNSRELRKMINIKIMRIKDKTI